MSTRAHYDILAEQALFDFENPLLAATFDEKVLNGLSYRVNRNWSIKMSAEKAGISVQNLKTYV